MSEKTTIFYNLIDDTDVMISLMFFEELRNFLDKIVGSEEPINYFKMVPLMS